MSILKWNRSRRAWAPTVALVAILVLAGACGDDGDDGADQTTAPTTTATTEPTTDTSASSSSTTTETTETTTTTEPASGRTVQVFFSSGDGADCSLVTSFDRMIGDDVEPIRATMDLLVAGPTSAESDTGAGSFFSSETAGGISGVTLSEGLLVVDFIDLRPLIPNASTSCGSAALLAQLNSTALQFPEVDRVRYRIDGGCSEFANWLQRECFDIARDGTQTDVPTNEQASASGCTPPDGEGLPDGRWFGLVDRLDQETMSFDLACWFTGTAAAAAAAEDGEESPPPNDYHIRNSNGLLRTLDVSPAAKVGWLPEPGNPESLAIISYAEWRDQQSARPFQPGVWLTIDDGLVVLIDEQYVP